MLIEAVSTHSASGATNRPLAALGRVLRDSETCTGQAARDLSPGLQAASGDAARSSWETWERGGQEGTGGAAPSRGHFRTSHWRLSRALLLLGGYAVTAAPSSMEKARICTFFF